MDLNTICILGVGILICYIVYQTQQSSKPFQNLPRFLWNEQVGRSKQIQSKNGDASMNVELIRRRAIQSSAGKLYESRTASGASTGAVEAYMLSSICPRVCKKSICLPDILFDGGGANASYCPILGSVTYNAGGATTRVCGI